MATEKLLTKTSGQKHVPHETTKTVFSGCVSHCWQVFLAPVLFVGSTVWNHANFKFCTVSQPGFRFLSCQDHRLHNSGSIVV